MNNNGGGKRDRPRELLEIIETCKGFGTVAICFAGSRFACSIDDLREAIRRKVASADRDIQP